MVADQDAILDQCCAVRRRAFVVHRQRTAAVFDGAIIDDRHARGGDALAHQARESGGLLAVEVAFQPMADRFVQQDARPAIAQHDRHFTGMAGDGGEIYRRLAQGFVDRVLPVLWLEEQLIAGAPAAAIRAGFLPVALAKHDADIKHYQRANIGGAKTIRADDLYCPPAAG